MKRLIVCADGTWNIRDQVNEKTHTRRPTNVTKLARAVLPTDPHGIPQVVIYLEGVGTGPGMDKLTGGAFGSGIEDNIVSLYRSIIYNYSPGDEIYLFGFSRGAFTVRSLAGFMKLAGFLEKDDDYYTPDFYACYEAGRGPGTPEWTKANHNVRDRRLCPEITMIGVWDTVGSLGAPGVLGQVFSRKKYQYHKVDLFPEIRNAFHALAIDEKRKPFAPTLWEAPPGWGGNLEQAWFAGVHCGVGGGYPTDGLANAALRWILGEAAHLGVAFDTRYLDPFKEYHQAILYESMDLKYKALGAITRQLDASPALHESIHESALKRIEDPELGYRPPNALAYLASGTPRITKTRAL